MPCYEYYHIIGYYYVIQYRSLSLISVDLAHFYAAAFARPARRPMVVVRLPNTGYRDLKGVVKFLGPTADGKVARRGAPQMRELTSLFQPLNPLSG